MNDENLVTRRDGRVAEGARLESVYTGNRIGGSNPSLSARFILSNLKVTKQAATRTATANFESFEPVGISSQELIPNAKSFALCSPAWHARLPASRSQRQLPHGDDFRPPLRAGRE